MALVGLALALHQMNTFHSVLAIETCCVVLEEDFDVLCRLHAVLHHLGCTEEWLAHDEIDLLAKSRKIESVFAGCVTTTHHGAHLLAIEEAVACGTGANALSAIFLFVFQSQILGTGTRCNNHGVGRDFSTIVYCQYIRFFAKIHLCDDAVAHFCTE